MRKIHTLLVVTTVLLLTGCTKTNQSLENESSVTPTIVQDAGDPMITPTPTKRY